MDIKQLFELLDKFPQDIGLEIAINGVTVNAVGNVDDWELIYDENTNELLAVQLVANKSVIFE